MKIILNERGCSQNSCYGLDMTKKSQQGKKFCKHETDLLIDIENVVGASELTAANVIEVKTAMDLMEGANVMQVVACSHHNAEVVMFNWPKARIILKSGKDGADLALIKVATDEDIAKRFNRVVIASGDGIFTTVAKELSEQGVEVSIVCGRGALSKNLQHQCPNIRNLSLTALELKENGNV